MDEALSTSGVCNKGLMKNEMATLQWKTQQEATATKSSISKSVEGLTYRILIG